MPSWSMLPIPIDHIPVIEYGNERFIEIHLDDRYNFGENIEICKVWMKNNDSDMIIEKQFKVFYDADQCVDFITSYQWRKVFLTLNDKFSYLIELIHNLPQIVYFYIYSTSPERISYKIEQYPKLRTIVQENSPGSDDRLLEDIKVFQRDLMPVNVVEPIKRKTKLLIQESLNIDEYSVVWLQDNRNSTTIDSSPITNIINSLKTFSSLDQCIDFIKSSGDTKLFFISSHSNNDMVLGKVSDYSQVIAIYILEVNQELTVRSQHSNIKLHGVYPNIESLCAELSKEYDRHLKQSPIPVSVFLRDKNEKTVRDLNKDNVRFLWFQLLIDILIKIPYNDQAKDEMLHECRKHYGIPCNDDEDVEENIGSTPMNNSDKNKIEKDMLNFEMNYKPTKALKFYTNDSFLYRLFNRAFRTENIDLLFIFRFFLADMYKQLQELYSEQYPDSLPHTVFRGQVMTNMEFDSVKNNIGRLISINTFFSTSIDRTVAEIYAGFNAEPDPVMQIVLFEIEMDVTNSTVKRPFASIGHLSTMPDELEVMFSVGSMFRIESVQDKRTTEKHWHVKLKLVEDDSDINELRNELENKYCDESDLCSLGIALRAMGDYERAERYFRMLLEYFPEDHSNLSRIYSALGMITRDRGDYLTSLTYNEKALEYLKKPTIYDERESIGREYVQIGASHQRLGNLDLAMKYFTMATDIQKSPTSLSYTYNQIGLLYRDKGDKRLALEYFQKTLHIEEQVLKTNQYQPVLATMYNNIGEIFSQLGDYENALKHLQHALDIRLKGTVSTHTDLAAIYHNLGTVYRNKHEFEKALEVLEKALEIDTQTFGDNHESLALTHSNIGAVYHELNDLARALYHAETALRIFLRSQAAENSPDIFRTQYHIGVIQFKLGNNIKALKITQKALQNQLKILPQNHETFVGTYLLLSKICRNQQDKPRALEYMEKVVEIARISILPNDKSEFQNFQDHLDILKNEQCDDSVGGQWADGYVIYSPDNPDQQDHLLSSFCEELTQTSSDDILKRLNLLNNIGSIYSRKENFPMALKYLHEAIDLFTKNQASGRLFPQQLEVLITSTFFSTSRVYYRQENWTMSLQNLEKALNFALKQSQEHPMLAEIYHAMGASYAHKLDIFMAIHYLELAITTAKKHLPDDHPRVQIYLNHLRQLKSSM
jgi:tetratricopeptide (TPR) repeat protein